MPTAAPMAVAMTPTRSDSLAPYRMRERMQRPNSSVPGGNSADGPARARGRSWRIGSWGATRGAANARRISTRISPSPATARRWRRKRRHASFIADARIEPTVEQIHGEVHEHEHHGHEQYTSLHHGVVALEDRRHGQTPHSGPGEDRLGDDGAPEKEAVLEPHHGDHGNQRVGEGVLADHAERRHALGAGRGDVLAPEHVEHARSREPADDGDGGGG